MSVLLRRYCQLLYSFTGDWLTTATVQAIRTAFGVLDGNTVINATNVYLTDIASTDKSKAQQIADWLNAYAVEDAKIVYSLVEGIGTRYIRGTGSQYINLGIIPSKDTVVTTKVRANVQNGTYMHIFGSQDNSISANSLQCLRHNSSYFWCAISNGEVHTSKVMTIGVFYDIYASHREFKIDGVNYNTSTSSTDNGNIPFWLFWTNRNGSGEDSKLNGDVVFFKATACIDGKDHWFVPFVRNNVNVLLDLFTGEIGTNSGSFTISEILTIT